MFVLASIQDAVRVGPSAFGRPARDALREGIDAKYAGRVLAGVGWCVCCRDVTERGEGLVYPLDGGATYRCSFTLLVFRPWVGEVVQGVISGCDERGVTVSLGFFSHVRVPAKYLPEPSSYDPAARLWTWTYDGQAFPLDVGLTVRARVAATNFTRVSQHKRGLQATTSTTEKDAGAGAAGARPEGPAVRFRSSSVDLQRTDPLPAAMEVVGNFAEDGLGPCVWWPDEDVSGEAYAAPGVAGARPFGLRGAGSGSSRSCLSR